MLIANYGHHWKRKYINWGRPGKGNKGNLLGYSGIRKDREVDFRNQIAIYLLYDKNFVPVYIGQTQGSKKKLFDRLRDHDVDHLAISWDYFSWFGFLRVGRNNLLENNYPEKRKVNFLTALNHIEAILITAIQPVLNKQGGRWVHTKLHGEYFQCEDDRFDDLKLSDLNDAVEDLKSEIGALKQLLSKSKI